jgi:adenine-specific DNA-methyltransferase
VQFGSNFQPFVRKRDVKHNDDDLTREPETVKAYRDTWELGLHSYLTYLRDRFLLARDLLAPTGSIFVQINDDNLAIVQRALAEVFGDENFVVTFPFKKKGGQKGGLVDPVNDFVVWFAKDKSRTQERFSSLYERAPLDAEFVETFRYVELADGRELTLAEFERETNKGKRYYRDAPHRVLEEFPGSRIFKSENVTVGGQRKNQSVLFSYGGRDWDPALRRGRCWAHTARSDDGSPSGMDRLAAARRLFAGEDQLRFKGYWDDFGFKELSNWWDGIGGPSDPIYAVQTNEKVIQRCMLMTTRPGDLVLDPTCGSGTTAYVAEAWGRRWITIDTSRVPMALARQRLLSATFDYYELVEEKLGPAGGFVYRERKNKRGEHVGGIVPHITSTSIANDEPPEQVVMVDRPDKVSGVLRVSGPFCVEATIPGPVDFDGDGIDDSGTESDQGSFIDRMLEVLRRSPVIQVGGGKTVAVKNVRPPVKSLSLSAEGTIENGTGKPAAFVFGPESGAVSERLVFEAAREAHGKGYAHLYVIGFAIQPNARRLIEDCERVVGVLATYVQATPDLVMGDLLKTTRSSQIFSVCGLPDVELRRLPPNVAGGKPRYQVTLRGLDVFDPVEMKAEARAGNDVPCWMLDTDHNGLVFHGCQVFFPRTAAWDGLKKALKASHDDTVWRHLSGTESAPFAAGEHDQIAVKVIDDRGNELLVVKNLKDAVDAAD